MIGPVAPAATFLTWMDYGDTAPTQAGVRLMASDGSTQTARTTSGIVSLGGNTYGKLLTAPATEAFYVPTWDDNNGTARYPDEVVWVSSILATINTNAATAAAGGGGGGGAIGTPLPLITDSNGQLEGKTFLIKRNDTLPKLRRQLIDEATGSPVDLTDVGTVYLNMRRIGVGNSPDTGASAPKVHALATVITGGGFTAVDGIVEYAWLETDTNQTTDGGQKFAAEFEVTFLNGSIETFPQADYITVTIPTDLDPGIDP